MCGINGTLIRPSKLINKNLHLILNRMNDQIVHRGPDDEGIFIEDGVGMAMRRLAIIDLESGKQPFLNDEKTIVIVYNGEIYNYRDLRSELEKEGMRFNTASDTEVILRL